VKKELRPLVVMMKHGDSIVALSLSSYCKMLYNRWRKLSAA
jgi:hypothetical protein